MGVQRMVFVSASFPPFPATIPLRGYIEVLSVALSASLSLSLSLCVAPPSACALANLVRAWVCLGVYLTHAKPGQGSSRSNGAGEVSQLTHHPETVCCVWIAEGRGKSSTPCSHICTSFYHICTPCSHICTPYAHICTPFSHIYTPYSHNSTPCSHIYASTVSPPSMRVCRFASMLIVCLPLNCSIPSSPESVPWAPCRCAGRRIVCVCSCVFVCVCVCVCVILCVWVRVRASVCIHIFDLP